MDARLGFCWWTHAIDRLTEAATNQREGRAKKHWFTGQQERGTPRVLLVVVRPGAVAEHDALLKLQQMPYLLEQAVNQVMLETGYPASIKTIPRLETFDTPYKQGSLRLRLMMGP
ncbi:hypothetical protein [Paraburkholderia sp. Cpub6]|uniref:hypothetical protein n=1 Tax=Paraburkholderia sp. Cpub6 TaxID=2723094 RepID=UPI00162195D2|nr:hypothetical protein [Paraburkholderia sp. Cpub6]MBB5463427.1 hypothetical protein [Paraburkholderia sp. Cpub6]